MRYFINKIFIGTIFLAFSGLVAIAQPNDPNTDPDQVPLTGIELLLGAGALFGVKKIFDKRKGSQSSNL